MKKSRIVVDHLLRSFYKLLFISLGASVILSYLIFFIPLNGSFQREERNYFQNEVKIKATTNEHMILDFISAAEAIGSRTVIRQKLAEYQLGTVELDELKQFTQSKYTDGASVIHGLIGASRHLPDGTIIASWGDSSIYLKNKEAISGFHILKENEHLFALVVSSIKEKGVYIGYDACVFNADILIETKSEIVRSYKILDEKSVDTLTSKLTYSIPLYKNQFILTAEPVANLFKNATLKALYFVSLYSSVLFIFISIFSYFTFYRFVKNIINDHIVLRKKADGLLHEKELILKEVHHRIKNNMNTISGLLSLQASTVSEPNAIKALEDAKNRIHSMSLLYDKLYRSVDFNEISVKEYFSSLVDDVLENFPNRGVVRVEKNLQNFNLNTKCLQPLGIIINELLTNIMKYAFKGRDSGMIVFSATNINRHVAISVQDDGIGMPESVSFEHSTGFGLQLVQALTHQLNGTIRIERGNGTKVVLEFDI